MFQDFRRYLKGEHVMSDEKIDLDVEFAKLGAKKVGQWIPANPGKEIDFSSIPGVRCVMPPPSRVEAETKPAESGEKIDDSRELA
jgi:hypothetical protein